MGACVAMFPIFYYLLFIKIFLFFIIVVEIVDLALFLCRIIYILFTESIYMARVKSEYEVVLCFECSVPHNEHIFE